ncbi:hypothetical protein GCM10007907_05540 [Chitinimonas prasina]|uniref:Alginate export domain-containing protein n=1 Tax=Chitinimonas prasina TaxID=1434937 RepID=A0ABQ5YCZ9_9NEIS|nr:hypothetical protein [Chitinimonas prasina]GLR11764.1 hypothetical protein GCM10007907_05540 [Chitinimonas prasina]
MPFEVVLRRHSLGAGLVLLLAGQGAAQADNALFADELGGREARLGGVLKLGSTLVDEPERERAYLSSGFARLEYEQPLGPSGKLIAHGQLDLLAASDRRLYQAMRDQPGPVDRSLTLHKRLEHGHQHQWRASLDWLYYQHDWEGGRLTLGRQPVSLTQGRIWSPADLLAPFAPGDLERLYKPGVDGIRLAWSATADLNLTSMVTSAKVQGEGSHANFLQQADWADERGKTTLLLSYRDGQRSVALSRQHNNLLAGADVYGELAASRLEARSAQLWRDRTAVRAVVGLNRKVAENTLLTLEYFYQSLGVTEPADYAAFEQRAAQTDLPAMGLGRHKLGMALSRQVSTLLSLEGQWQANLNDGSSAVSGLLKYSLQKDLELRAAFSLAVGGKRDSEYRRLGNAWQLGMFYYW